MDAFTLQAATRRYSSGSIAVVACSNQATSEVLGKIFTSPLSTGTLTSSCRRGPRGDVTKNG
jgi:hypothetical protein